MGNAGRESTTLSIVEIDLSTLATLQAPTYRVVRRESVDGHQPPGDLRSTAGDGRAVEAAAYRCRCDRRGEGLWAMLDKAFRTRVIPVKFTQQEKSEIGWRFLSIIETGGFGIAAERHRSDSVQDVPVRDPAGAGEDPAVGRSGRHARAGRRVGA